MTLLNMKRASFAQPAATPSRVDVGAQPTGLPGPYRYAIAGLTSMRIEMAGYALVLGLAALVRWLLMLEYYAQPNSDQAIIGLMARHILAGEHPAFYWGQSYNGTLETYLTALALKAGADPLTALHLPPIAFGLLFVGATMALCRQLYTPALALACGLYLAVGPPVLIEYSVLPGYNYLQTMALGTTALVLAIEVSRRGRWWPAPIAAFALGLALWAQPLAIAYVPAVLAVLVGPARAAWHKGTRGVLIGAALLSLLGGLLGLLPVLAYNLHSRWSTLTFLMGRPNHAHLSTMEIGRRLLVWAGPVLSGLIPPSEDPDLFQRYLHAHVALYVVALLLVGLALLATILHWRTLLRWCASAGSARPAGELALLVLAFTLITSYLFSTWSTSRWSATDPRYLLPLYTLAPLLLRAAWPRGASMGRRLAGAGILLLMATAGLAANASASPHVDDPHPLTRLLETRGDTAVYGDYWLVYRLAFASDERLVPLVTGADLRLGYNRYAPYIRVARQEGHFAWLLPAGSQADRMLQSCLARHHARFQRVRYGSLAIYDHIAVGGRCIDGQ